MSGPAPPTRDELRALTMFARLDDAKLDELLGLVRARELNERERLFEHGQPATHFFALRSGCVKLVRLSPDGGEKVLALINPGETFAEAVLFFDGDRRYPVTAEATRTSEVLAFDGDRMLELLRGSVETCFRMMASMSRRLRWQLDEIEHLTLHNATFRLVNYLLRHAPEDDPTVRLPVAKHVIASRLNIQPETLSRILARLSRDRLIDARGQEITLKDRPGLQRILDE